MGNIEVKTSEKFTVAYIHHVGPYNTVGPVFGEVFEWLAKKRLESGPAIGIYYDNPEEVSPKKCRSDICVSFEGEAEPDERVRIKEIGGDNVVFTSYKGPWKQYNIPETYRNLRKWINENEYVIVGPAREVYLKFPRCPPNVHLEVYFPVKKLLRRE